MLMTNAGFSPVEFFLMAGSVGRVVMLILSAGSIWCWVLILEGVYGIYRFRRALRSWHRGGPVALLAPIVEAGDAASGHRFPGEGIGDVRIRMIDAMNHQARLVIANVEGGLANLAVIASVSPFVGLFGTVWGIMSSFTAIAVAKDTSLAVVAPGIAEALATTAFGLFAAIPASVGYTRIGASIVRSTQDLAGLIESEAMKALQPQTRHHALKEAV